MPVTCPNCRHQLPEMKKFCPYCGYHFEETVAQQPTQQPKQSVYQQPLQQSAQPVYQQPLNRPEQPVYQQPQNQLEQPAYQQSMNQPQQPPKQKKGKKGFIIILLIILVLVAGIVAGAVVLYPMLQKSGALDTLESKVEERENKEDKTEADTEVKTETASENPVISALQEKMDAGEYETAIEEILAMKDGDDSYEDALAFLQEAVEGQMSACMEEVDNLAAAGSFTDAFDALEEELTYRKGLTDDERTAEMVSDNTTLDDRQESLLEEYQVYVIQEAYTCATNRDEDGIDQLFSEADERLDGEGYDASKIAVYAKMVVTEANGMNADGDSAAEVLDYIDSKLEKTENDCWVLELWDYFNALKEYQTGNVTESTKVKHVTNGYILPNSDSDYLSDSDLSKLSRTELRMARYEIYARHGRTFSDEEVANYFGQYDWYDGSIQPEDFQEADLNEYEKANKDLLVAYEEFMGYR